jgi:hypothetical protein
VPFEIKYHPRVEEDIEQAFDSYESKQVGLGSKFFKELNTYIEALSKNPWYAVRYDNIRCLPLKKFPYMIHFRVDEKIKQVYIESVLNCYLDPESSWVK